MSINKNFSIEILKSVVISIITALILVLIFALFIKLFSFSDVAIKISNIIIKIVSVFIGVFLSIKDEQGLLKGGIAGVISLLLAYILFAVLGGGFQLGIKVVWEVLLGLVIGAGAGILAVNSKIKI